jgi:ATP-binding cassette subfamily B protein
MRGSNMRPGRFTYSPNAPEERPKVTARLIKRVFDYARLYLWWLLGMLVLTLATTGLSLLTPLILRDLIDRTLPARDLNRLIWLSVGLVVIPLLSGGLNVVQRQVNARVGEGVVYDLRSALFSHLQRMSLSFFTHTKVGELMSRLNNDVVGAQNAISSTFVNIITSFIQAIVLLTMMLTLEWRLTLISIAVLPLFLVAARNLGNRLRDIARLQLDLMAKMNAMMNELLNISGALLVKLFGRTAEEDSHFRERAAEFDWSGACLWHRRLPRYPASSDHRHHRGNGSVLRQSVRRAAEPYQRASRFRNLYGQLRARL